MYCKFPLRVISGHLRREKPCPLYPQKRTCAAQHVMSALCQKRTFRHSFDHLVGALDLGHPECETEISNLLNPIREYDDTVQMLLFVMRDTAKLGERN